MTPPLTSARPALECAWERGIECALALRPCRGEIANGDATVLRPIDGGCFAAVVDALGHGREAHEVAVRAEALLARKAGSDPVALLRELDLHLRGSRGAAAGLCAIDGERGTLAYAGIGNTVIRRFGASESRLVSRDGVLGQNVRTPKLQTLELAAGDTVLLYTDGVKDRFQLDDYRGLLFHDVEHVARAVIERFGKQHDDAACIAIRYRP